MKRLGLVKAATLDHVAQSFNMSGRTLKRRLGEEGTTYRRLADRICIKTAEHMLRDSTASIQHIAYVLGYSGANNFIGAFHRAESCSPGEYRKRGHSD